MSARLAVVASAAAMVATATAPRALADPPRHRPSIGVVVAGDETAVRAVRSALDRPMAMPFDLLLVRPPAGPLPDRGTAARSSEIESRMARAQQAYVDADFEACFSALGEETEVLGQLGAGRRETAERLLFWRVACAVGASERADAELAARRFAVLGLEVPSLVAASHPLVANVLALARESVLAQGRRQVRIESTAAGAAVAVDGRRERCSVPCSLDLLAGDHVLAVEADGYEPRSVTVRVDERTAVVRLDPRPAGPDLAALQWSTRWSSSPAVDSAASMRLLARAVRARRLILVAADHEGAGLRLRSVLAVDGRPVARGERQAEDMAAVGDDLAALLRDLLVRGRLLEPAPPLWGRAWFWVAVGAAAAAAAAVTAAIVWAPDTRTEVWF